MEALYAELAGVESDMDMRRAQGKAMEIKQLIKTISVLV